MNARTKKTAAGILGATVLAGSALLATAPMYVEQGDAVDASGESQEAQAVAAIESAESVQMDKVEGSFSYDQNVTCDSASISDVFRKAASALCSSLPQYEARTEAGIITLNSADGTSFQATTSELADSKGSDHRVMTCACSSNVPGGGAIANADVEGVSVASLARQAGAL